MEIRNDAALRHDPRARDAGRARPARPDAGAPAEVRSAGEHPLAARLDHARSALERRIAEAGAQLEERIAHAQRSGQGGRKLDELIARARGRLDGLATKAAEAFEANVERLRASRQAGEVPAPRGGEPADAEARSVPPAGPEGLADAARRELDARGRAALEGLEARISGAVAGSRDPRALEELITQAREQLLGTITAARESLELRIRGVEDPDAPRASEPAPSAPRAGAADSLQISDVGRLLARAADAGRLDAGQLERLRALQQQREAGLLNTEARIEASALRLLSGDVAS